MNRNTDWQSGSQHWDRSKILQLVVAVVTVFCSGGVCSAQMERYELGKRLRRFEQSWQAATETQRKPSAAIMQEAVSSFFSLNLLGAAQKLDEAWLTTRDQTDDGWIKALAAYRVKVSARMLSEQTEFVKVSLDRFYKTQQPVPDVSVSWTIQDQFGKTLQSQRASWSECLEGVDFPVKQLSPGDYNLVGTIERGDSKFELPAVLLSRIDNIDAALKSLEEASRAEESTLDPTLRATFKDHLSLLKSIQNGTTPESDFPAHRIVKQDLQLLSADTDSVKEILSRAAVTNDQWLTLTKGKRKLPVRLRSAEPRKTNGKGSADDVAKKMPVLILFHGAGGSENMFFETYGAGKAVEEGLKRGWLVVASRQSLMGLGLNCEEMLDDLERFFSIDRSQVYLLGHSMGAAQVIRQASINPGLPRAAAVIGGGGATREAKQLGKIAWYVSAGQLDFGKSGAVSFYQSLKRANIATVKYEEFANIEHMVIVQAALPKVFEFFDTAAKGQGDTGQP